MTDRQTPIKKQLDNTQSAKKFFLPAVEFNKRIEPLVRDAYLGFIQTSYLLNLNNIQVREGLKNAYFSGHVRKWWI